LLHNFKHIQNTYPLKKNLFGYQHLMWGALSITFHVMTLAQSPALPDRSITPGAVDPAVTPHNIQSTVCVRGYTDKVRPDKKYTNRLKHEQIKQYRYADRDPRHYELDHLIPLNIGGNPSDPKNLWPQSREGEWSAEQKNDLEFVVYKMVCLGEISLHEAQNRIAQDWIEAYRAWVPTHQHLLPHKRRTQD
jgi:hypothetical protein